jgi:hypothetical protein
MRSQIQERGINCLGNYHEFLSTFQNNGYDFKFFNELESPFGNLILRHDIDFDVELAYECAKIEYNLGIKSTYFFLLRSDFYNLFEIRTYELVKLIKELGHEISIHFDPTLYEDFNVGLSIERSFFNHLFNVDIKIISLHRPNDFFLKYNLPISGISHTYQDAYFKDVKYFADSTGTWRFGNPLNSDEFNKNKSIHLLIHPIWWMVEGGTNLDILKNHFKNRVLKAKNKYEQNSIPFRSISHEF